MESNVEKDSLKLVLDEFIRQQKEMAKQINDLKSTIASLGEKTGSFEGKLENFKITPPPADSASIRAIISQGISEIKRIVSEQPKNILPNKRFLFFPEHNAREYYSVVLRWVLYIIIATYCYLLLKHIADHWAI